MKSPVLPPNLVWAIALGLISSLNSLTLAQASTTTATQTPASHQSINHQAAPFAESILIADKPPNLGTPGGRRGGGGAHYKPPKPPGTLGTPGGRPRGGAGRGNCPKVQIPLTILIPNDQISLSQSTKITSVWGLSTSEKPTFWFFVPYDNSSNFSAEFALQNAQGKDVYRQAVALPKQPGVIAVHLPDSVPPLETGVPYQTYFTVKCGNSRSSQSDFVKGWVQRIALSPTVANQIATAKPHDRPAIHANNGLWFDALTTIAELRLKQPNDVKLLAEWQSLLESANLSDVADQPLVQPSN
jgi:hypothetical protein